MHHERADDERLARVAVGQRAPEREKGQSQDTGERDDRPGPRRHVRLGNPEAWQVHGREREHLAVEGRFDEAGDGEEGQQPDPGGRLLGVAPAHRASFAQSSAGQERY